MDVLAPNVRSDTASLCSNSTGTSLTNAFSISNIGALNKQPSCICS